jgi:hypothetical protein
VVFFYKDLAYDARGLFVSDLQYVGMGDDGTWFTGDDEIGYRTAYTYDVDARLTMQTSYNGPGADAVWESADDEVSNYLAYEPGDKSLHRGRTVYFEAAWTATGSRPTTGSSNAWDTRTMPAATC